MSENEKCPKCGADESVREMARWLEAFKGSNAATAISKLATETLRLRTENADLRQQLEAAKAAPLSLTINTSAPLLVENHRLREAVTRQLQNIERWLATGVPAGPDESQSIYDQLKAALDEHNP